MKKLITIMLFFVIASFTIAQGSLDSGLVAFYQFNGNANDESGYGNDGSLMNGVSFDNDRWNNPNQAIRFNKSLSQYVDVQNSPSLQIDSAISFSFWTKRNTLDNGQDQVLNKGGDWPGGTCNYGLVFSEWTLVFIYNGGYYIVNSPGVPLDNEWHHYAVTALEGTTEIHFYVDGVEKTSMFGGGNPVINLYSQSTSDLYLGGVIYYSNNTMDELKIYKRILSEIEIKSLYSDLVAYYPFNGNANDESGNGYNGFVSGATLTPDRFNEADNAYNFVYNGFSSDKIQVSGTSGLNFSTGGFSLSAWIKFSGTAGAGNNYPIISKHICGEQSGYILMLYNGKLTFWLAGASGYNILSTSADYTDETWHQVVAVYDDVNQYIYVDGVLKNSIAFDYNVYNAADWALGGYNGCNGGFNGKLDEVKIYNRPLGAAEILEDYNLTKNSLVAYLPFNGNTIDVSGNGHDGTINANVTLVADRFNSPDRAYTFPDQSSHIALTNSTNLNLENGFTINAWIKYKGGRQRVIIDKHMCGYPNGFAFVIDWDNQIAIYLASSGWSTVRTNGTFTEDQWYMVTAIYNASAGIAKVYVDGEVGGSGSVTAYNDFSPYPITIGESYQNNCQPGNMDGAVDEVKIYNRPLSDAEILDEYNNTYNDLVLFLPFNGNANDESGNNNNGTVSGASLTQDRFGVENKAYQFNGSSDYINVTNSTTLTITDETTLSAWVKRTRYNTIDMILEKGGDWTAGTTNYGLSLHYFNNMYYFFFNGGWRGTTGVSDYEWHHYAAVIKNGDANPKLYIDGELKPIEFQEGSAQISLYPSTADLDIGAQLGTYTYYSANIIDDIRIYNRNLSDQEIILLYNDSTTYFPPLEDGLVAYWPLDGNTDDSTSFNNDGINYNGVFSKDRYANDTSAIYFDGVDSYIEGINPGNNLPIGNSSRSFSAWVKNYQYNQYGSNIFHYGTQQAAPTNFHFLITDVLGLGNGYGYGVVYGNTNLIDSTWHFVTGVYEGGSERITKLYIDGKLDVTGSITTEPNTVLTNNWRIGRFMDGSTNFKGNIDELKVYDIPLSNQQIWDMYQATTTAPTLLFPGNDSTLINPQSIALDWDSTVTANEYHLIIASDSLFNIVIKDTITITSSVDLHYEFFIYYDNQYWKVRTINDGGTGPWSEVNHFSFIYTDVEDETQLPKEFALLQNYPNPFNPTTTITYHLPKTAKVELKVYDVIGNEIAKLVNEEKPAGVYEVEFGTRSSKLSSGIYLYKLTAGDFVQTKKMILVK